MNHQQLLTFIAENQQSDLKDFYNKSYSKLQDLNKRIDKTTLYLLIIVLIYFLLAKSSIESFNIGPFTIKDINAIGQLLPVAFAYLLFDLVISSIHKTEVSTTVKFIFLTLYKQDIEFSDLSKNKNNIFTRILLPFSFTSELSRLNSGKTPIAMGCVGALLALPLITLYVLPLILEIYMLSDIFIKSHTETIAKISFYLTIYINVVIIYYYVKVSINNYNDLKAEEAQSNL